MGIANKVFAVLELFDERQPCWHVDDIGQHLGLSRATAYRYTKELLATGLLQKHPVQGLVLGFRALQMGRCVQHRDPLLRAASTVLPHLAQRSHCTAAISVLTPRGEMVDVLQCAPGQAQPVALGSSRPLAHAGAALLQLAFVPASQQEALVRQHLLQHAHLRHWATWPACYSALQALQSAQFLSTTDERGASVTDAAVPICTPDGAVIATLNLVQDAQAAPAADPQHFQALLDKGAWEIRKNLAAP